MIPEILRDISEYLKGKIDVMSSGIDSRSDSSMTEHMVVSHIQNANKWYVCSPNIGTGHNRAWYDLKIDDYYCDIKITTCMTADNTNAKKAIYYFLTGKDPGKISDRNDKFYYMMKKNENQDNKRDYYYLIINKKNKQDIFPVSLKHINDVTPSGNNLPFQARWNFCREGKYRTWKEARDFLLDNWANSISKKIQASIGGMPKEYPEFFKNKNMLHCS